MPTFDTPEPISVTMDLVVGDTRITASDRTNTVVEVRPRDGSKELDVQVADQTRVEFAEGKLLIKAPKVYAWLRSKVGSIEVTIELPADSDVRGDTAAGEFRCVGRLGDCRLKSASGDIQLDHAGALRLNTASGKVTVDRAVGNAVVITGSGDVHIREIDGAAVIKNANGDTWVGVVTSDLRANAANGDIAVDRAYAGVTAKTYNGDVRIGEVVRGSVVLASASGELEVGIREGTAAWLDVNTWSGRVHNSLETADGAEPSAETVEVRARTYSGDIVIRRS